MRWRFAIINTCWLWMTACGGDDADLSDGREPDAGAPAAPDAGGPGPDGGAGEMSSDAAPPDAAPSAPDGGPTGPTIESVETSDGFTQVRQGESVQLVITGAGLDGVTRVAVGEIAATLSEQAAGEVKASLSVPHATAPGPRDITVSGPAGSGTALGAVEVTAYVVAPSAAAGGHGTFQSPLNLCDPLVGTSEAGDTLLLLAGRHGCAPGVSLGEGGQIVQGQGTAETMVGGPDANFLGFFIDSLPSSRASTTFRDLTIQTRLSIEAIRLHSGGQLVVDRVAFEGPVTGISLQGCQDCFTRATVTNSSFIGLGVEASGGAQLDVSGSSFTRARVGIRAARGRFTIRGTTFDGCTVGVSLDRGEPGMSDVRGEIADSIIREAATGLRIRAGELVVTDTVIQHTPSDQPSIARGVFMTDGELEARRVTISDYAASGIEAFVSPEPAASVSVRLADVLIEGGQYGVRLHGESIGGGLFMSSSIVRGQTVAAVSYDFEVAEYDLGGGNELSVVSGVALEDARIEPFFIAPVDATGIRLNGTSPSGLARGPIEQVPDYRIVGRGAILFSPPTARSLGSAPSPRALAPQRAAVRHSRCGDREWQMCPSVPRRELP